MANEREKLQKLLEALGGASSSAEDRYETTIENQLLRLQAIGIAPPPLERPRSALQTISDALELGSETRALLGLPEPEELTRNIQNPWLRGFLSFLYDIATDPMTYLSFGVTSAGRIGVRAALPFVARRGTQLVGIPGTEAIVQAARRLRAHPTVEQVVGAIAKPFRRAYVPANLPEHMQKALREMQEVVLGAERKLRGEGLTSALEAALRVAEKARGLSQEELMLGTLMVEHPELRVWLQDPNFARRAEELERRIMAIAQKYRVEPSTLARYLPDYVGYLRQIREALSILDPDLRRQRLLDATEGIRALQRQLGQELGRAAALRFEQAARALERYATSLPPGQREPFLEQAERVMGIAASRGSVQLERQLRRTAREMFHGGSELPASVRETARVLQADSRFLERLADLVERQQAEVARDVLGIDLPAMQRRVRQLQKRLARVKRDATRQRLEAELQQATRELAEAQQQVADLWPDVAALRRTTGLLDEADPLGQHIAAVREALGEDLAKVAEVFGVDPSFALARMIADPNAPELLRHGAKVMRDTLRQIRLAGRRVLDPSKVNPAAGFEPRALLELARQIRENRRAFTEIGMEKAAILLGTLEGELLSAVRSVSTISEDVLHRIVAATLGSKRRVDVVRSLLRLQGLPEEQRREVLERVAAVADELTELGKQLHELEKAQNIDYNTVVNYVMHLFREDPATVRAAMARLATEAERTRRATRVTQPFMKSRSFQLLLDAVRAGLTPDFDPVKIAAVRSVLSAKARVMKEMVDALKAHANDLKRGAIVVRRIKRGEPVPDGFVLMDNYVPALKGYAVHEELLRTIQEIDTTISDPRFLGRLFGAAAAVNRLLKGTVVLRPGFHIRNLLGNIFNMYLAGMPLTEVARWMAQAHAVLRSLPEDARVVLGGREYTVAELRRAFTREALGGFGFTVERLQGEAIAKEAARRVKEAAEKNVVRKVARKIVESGEKVGDLVESTSKMALFMFALDNGMDVAEAASLVRKYLFDYADLTKAERFIRTYFIPFYTWTRKELPILIEAIWKKPHVFTSLQAVHEGFMEAFGLTPEELPEWLLHGLAIPTGRTDQGVYVTALGLPTDVLATIFPGDFAETMQQAVLATLSPFWRVPLERAANRYFFSGAPIRSREFQVEHIGPIAVSPELYHLLSNIPLAFAPNIVVPARAALEQLGFKPPEGEETLPPTPERTLLQRVLAILSLPSWAVHVNPERQRAISKMLQAKALTDFIQMLQRDLGINVPTIRELEAAGLVPDDERRRRLEALIQALRTVNG